MIFGLHPLFGFLPLLLYIVLMMMGKDMNVSVLLCVILGAILTGESITGFADTLYASLGSFCASSASSSSWALVWRKSCPRQKWHITWCTWWSTASS